MADEYNVAVWDTCVLVHAIEKSGDRWTQIEPYLRDAERGDFTIVIPESVVAETKYLPKMQEDGVPVDEQVRLIGEFLLNPYIVRRPIHRGISELAAKIGRKFRIKRVGDSLAVATAVFWEVPILHTYDGNGKKKGLLDCDLLIGDKNKLKISVPNYGSDTLFATEADKGKDKGGGSGSKGKPK